VARPAEGGAGGRALIVVAEPGGGEARVAGRVVFRAVDLEERRGDGMEAEVIALLDEDAGGLAPDFDDEWFEHVSSSLGYTGGGVDPLSRQQWVLSFLADEGADTAPGASIWRRAFCRTFFRRNLTKQ
jgi:hypothetical protein